MLRLNWKYITFLGALFGLYFVLLYFMPHKFNWFITLYQKDKNPFGAYVFATLIDNSWLASINISNSTLYELNELSEPNLLVLCEAFKVAPSDIETLLGLVGQGKTAIIASHQMDTIFADSLGVKMSDFSLGLFIDNIWEQDSLGLRFVEGPFDTSAVYWLPEQMLPQHFESFDSTRTDVMAVNTDDKPVLLRIGVGKGHVLLCSTPLAFSNFSLMKSDNLEYLSGIFSLLVPGSLHWTEYYQLGRMEATTPLRYILSEPALKWALYTLMITILIAMFFKAKRKQRVIPVITPLKNETLDFVKTISKLYYHKKDHKGLALKKILHFTEYMKLYLHVDVNDEIAEVIGKVAAKTGSDEHEVKLLFDQIGNISNASYITAGELKIFMNRLEIVMSKEDYT